MKYAKYFAAQATAVASAFTVAVAVTVDNHLSLNDAFAIGAALFTGTAGAIAVLVIPNKEN